ncbi:MAG TPA: TetR/AcrR family transcriptional regulator [Solirubrobacteraceae bacterium]
MQRTRLLGAAVGLLADEGYERFSAGGVCGRAGVSRRTFYEVFENREDCLAGILTDTEARVEQLMASVGVDGLPWSEQVRMGLWSILCFAESDPALARVCLVESQRAGGVVQRKRQQIVDRLIAAVDGGRSRDAHASLASKLTAEALVGATSSVIAARLMSSGQGGKAAVSGLLGELMGMIVLPYLGPVAARREIKRALPPGLLLDTTESGSADPLAGLAMRLTYRTVRVIQALAELTANGGGASNRQIGKQAGISDAGQTSRLLWRLAQHDLLENVAKGNLPRGEANQWCLTATGRQLLRSITAQADARWENAA